VTPTYRSALITGASSGIGECFAAQLAAAGTDLILVARSKDKLDQLAHDLARSHKRKIEVIAMDLSRPEAGERLAEEVEDRGLSVDLLINNAGFGAASVFHKQAPERDRDMIALNVAAVVDLTHAFLPAMIKQHRGAVINIASMAAFQPTPYMSVYGASKAFVLSFTEGLWAEYRNSGLRFLAVCPGPVDTPFLEATGNAKLRGTLPPQLLMSADSVVRESLRALADGKSVLVPGTPHKLVANLPRLIPRQLLARVTALVIKR